MLPCNDCAKDKIEAFFDEIGPRKLEIFDSRAYRGQRVFDSFGFRMQVPGECDPCFEKYRQSYKSRM